MENQIGYGLRPTEEELVGFYLPNKIKGENSLVEGAISEVNICSYDPWNLRFQSKYKSRDCMWYFFSSGENKYANGNEQKRTTTCGKWKLTGKAVDVKDQCGIWCGTPGKKIGYKRVLVFLDGTKSEKTKSDWVIHEFHCELLPEHLRKKYVICRLEYKGNDSSILAANATDPTPNYVTNITNSAGSVVNQSRQGYSTSYNTDYDSPNQGQLFDENFIMQQPLQAGLGSFNASANHGHEFDMHQSSQGAYSNSSCPFPENNLPNYGQWSNDFLHNPQQSVPYSEPFLEDIQSFWDPVIPENLDSFVTERTYMQEDYSDHRPRKPVTGVIPDDSTDSETGSTIFEETSSSTDSIGSSNEPDPSPIDDLPSLNTKPFEAQEQTKQRKSHLQGKEKVINMQKSECKWKMAEDLIKKTPSTNTVKQSWIVLDKMSQRKSKWNYLKNIIIGVLLFISIICWIILVG